MGQGLGDEDLRWLIERVHELKRACDQHPAWKDRVGRAIDNLLWSASVDARLGDRIVQDGWVRAGQRIKHADFQNVPFTALALKAFAGGRLKEVKREHIVPRAVVVRIILQVAALDDATRVVRAYSRVALVHETETGSLKPTGGMPKGWDDGVDWTKPGDDLPDAWLRFRRARPPIVPRYHDGRTAFAL